MTPVIRALPPDVRAQALRNLLTTRIYLAQCEARRAGVDVRDVILSWAPR